MSKDSDQLQRIITGLKCSEAEAAEVLAYDKAVDHDSATPYDLTPAQNKVAQSYARTGTRKPTAYSFPKKPRKQNEPKRYLLALLEKALSAEAETVTTTNPERQLDFVYDGIKYRIVLSAPRK